MLRSVSGVVIATGLFCMPVFAQTPAAANDAKKEAERVAQGYAPTRLWERPDVRATRVDLKPMAIRAVHQHDDVKFHLFIPLTGKLQLTIGSEKPVDAPVGQAFYIKGGTPHTFRNLAAAPASAMEIFVLNGSTASIDSLGALLAGLRGGAPLR